MSDKITAKSRSLYFEGATDKWGFSYNCYYDSSNNKNVCTPNVWKYGAPYFDPGPIPSSVNILLGSSGSAYISGLYNPSG